jgi:ClpP class serine protease
MAEYYLLFLYYLLTSILFIFTIIIIYYVIYIYKSFSIITNIENKYKSKIIFVRDNNDGFIEKILMKIYNNHVISINDNNSLRKILQQNFNKNLMILLRSTGGYVSSSDSMINLLNSHKYKKSVYIPSYAMSAASLLALSCDNIYINKYATLGPTDPQILLFDEMVSFRTISKIVQSKNANATKEKILIAYYQNKIFYDDNIKIIKNCIAKHKKQNLDKNSIEEIVKMFSFGDIAHHTEITADKLEKFIKINTTIPQEINKIYTLLNYIFLK